MATPQPKPAKRGRKPRKPIQRSRAPIARKRRPPVRGRSARQRAEYEADRLWSLLVRTTAAGRPKYWCERCLAAPGEHAHHLISRRVQATRWELVNGAWVCSDCHDRCHRGAGYTVRNERLAVELVGPEGWLGPCERAAAGRRVDVFDMVDVLRAEVERRGLVC